MTILSCRRAMHHTINLKLSKILSLLPPHNVRRPRSFCATLHGLFIILVLLGMFAANVTTRTFFYYRHLQNLEKLLDAVIHTFTTLTNVNSLVCSVFLHRKHWTIMLNDAKNRFEKTNSDLYFCILTLLFALQTYFEIYFHARLGHRIIMYLIPSFVNVFIILISVLNINYFAGQLKNMLATFRKNLKLEKLRLDEIRKTETNPHLVSRMLEESSRADDTFRNFVDICHRLNSFNKIYGWQILNFAAVVLIFAYENLNVAFREVFKNNKYSVHSEIVLIKMLKCFNFLVRRIDTNFIKVLLRVFADFWRPLDQTLLAIQRRDGQSRHALQEDFDQPS
jgi:hypothetical protein